MKVDHAADIHAVDVVTAKNRDQVGVGLFHQVDVLKDGVGGPLVPSLAFGAHLRRHVDDELALQKSAELPAFTQMLQQRLAAKLREHINRVNPGIHEIAEHEIDDAVFAAEGNCRLRALAR